MIGQSQDFSHSGWPSTKIISGQGKTPSNMEIGSLGSDLIPLSDLRKGRLGMVGGLCPSA